MKTVTTYLTAEQSSWAYIVRGRSGLLLDSRYGYATREEAQRAGEKAAGL